MLIRSYRHTDSEAVLSIWIRASREAHDFFDEEELQRQKRIVRDIYLDKAEIYIAEEDDIITGFIGMLGTMVGALFVDPSHQCRGVGRALIRKMYEEKGPLQVEVFALNRAAQLFYERCGFEEIARAINEEVQPHQELVVMQLDEYTE